MILYVRTGLKGDTGVAHEPTKNEYTPGSTHTIIEQEINTNPGKR